MRPWDGHVWLMQPEAQNTTRGSLAVSTGALEIANVIQGAVEVFWFTFSFTFSIHSLVRYVWLYIIIIINVTQFMTHYVNQINWWITAVGWPRQSVMTILVFKLWRKEVKDESSLEVIWKTVPLTNTIFELFNWRILFLKHNCLVGAQSCSWLYRLTGWWVRALNFNNATLYLIRFAILSYWSWASAGVICSHPYLPGHPSYMLSSNFCTSS